MKTTIYRIENAKEYGPYTGPSKHSWKDEDHDSRVPLALHEDLYNKYPEIKEWCDSNSDENYPDLLQYGFSSIEQLEQWFTKSELLKLEKLGYVVVERRATKIFRLHKQIAFI